MCFINNNLTTWAYIQSKVMFSLNPHCRIFQLLTRESHSPEEHHTMKAVFVTKSVNWYMSLEVC